MYKKMTGKSDYELEKKINICIESIIKAETAKSNKQYDRAILYYQNVLSCNPNDPNVYREINLLRNINTGNNNQLLEKAEYRIGEKYADSEYVICYLDETKEHGWIMEVVTSQNNYYMDKRGLRIPNKDEMYIIYGNRHALGLNGRYWTSTISRKLGAWDFYYTLDFGTGKYKSTDSYKKTDRNSPYKYIYIKNF